MRHRVSSGDWHAALQPYPLLTAAALTLAALYALLAEGTAVATARNAFPAAERAQLALPHRASGGHLRALTGATTVPAAHAALATAAGCWTLTAAAIAGAVALALTCIGRRRTGARPSPGRNRDPE